MLNQIADILFPPRCFGCGVHLFAAERDDGCCSACAHTVHLIESPRCPQCAIPREVRAGVDELCSRCLTELPAFDATFARWIYDGAVSDAIRCSKTSDDPSSLFGLIDSDSGWFVDRAARLSEYRWTTPPVHRRDLVARGWDPARTACRRALGRRVQLEDPLQKARRTTKQARLGRDARRLAMRGSFVAESVDGDWVVFDDVMTTGATLDEAARALKEAGAKSVVGLVLARFV